LDDQIAIIMCYNHHIEVLANRILSGQIWAITEAICDAFSFVVTTYVVNQHCWYWLLLDVLTLTIKLYVKLSKERLQA
jgi:hypothetical protein